MLDETIKQIVLKFKMDDQANVGEVSKQLAKLNESVQKSIPLREASEFLKISEKIGGEFHKVAQSMTSIRMTQLKGDLRDINSQMGELQRQLNQVDQQVKSSALSGDAGGYASSTASRDQIMGQIANLGGRREAISGAMGGGFMSRNAGRIISGAQTISAVGGIYGGAESLEGYKQQAVIENRLQRIESYAADLRRAQENTYGGNVMRAYYDSRFSDMATRMAVASVTGQRRELMGQTVGAAAGVGGALVQGGMQGALTGLPGGPTGMAVGAVAGGVGAAGQQALSAERLRFQLSQLDESRRAEVMSSRREYMDRLAASAPDRYMTEFMFQQAPSRARMESTMGFGANVIPGLNAQALRTGVASREDVTSSLMSTRGRMGTTDQLTGIEAGISMMGRRVGAGTLQERVSLASGIQRNIPRMSGQQLESTMAGIQSTFEPGMQMGFDRTLTQGLNNAAFPVDVGVMGGRYAESLRAAQATGVSSQAALEGLARSVNMPEATAQSGTLENQVMRAAIRGPLLAAGVTGGLAAKVESELSKLKPEELEGAMSNPAFLRAIGINQKTARQIVARARKANMDVLTLGGMSESTKRRVMSGNATQADKIRMGIIGGAGLELGGAAARGSLLTQRVTGTSGTVGGRMAMPETDNSGIARAMGEGQAALEEGVSAMQQQSGGAIGQAALAGTREGLATIEGRRAITEGLVSGEMTGMSRDTKSPSENISQDLRKSLTELTSAIRGAASEIRRSFGSTGKTVK